MKGTKKYFKLALKVLLFISIIAIVAGVIVFNSIYFSAKLDKNSIIAQKAEFTVYSIDDTVTESSNIYRFIKYSDLPSHLVNAFVALEDKRFFSHKGVDYIRLGGALIHNVKAGYMKEGGSTITQQLAKNTQLSSEKTVARKIKELRLARLIEKEYSKEEILEMYLNAIYYGNGIYGIDSAARNYFGKAPEDLTLSESAYLAGIVKNPQKYSPKNHPDKATSRKNFVLSLMLEQKMISENEYDVALNEFYAPPATADDPNSAYVSAVIAEAAALLNVDEKDVITSKIKIFTYFDEKLQRNLYNIHQNDDFISVNDKGKNASSLAIIADNATGGIKSYYCNDELIEIGKFLRQPASTIKPIVVYAPAIESGLINAYTPVIDEKININGYSPSNYGGVYHGYTDVRTALKTSINTVAVKILNENGINESLSYAKAAGITFDKNDYNLSTALGGMTYGVTPTSLCEAYLTLANFGVHKDASFIRRIVDNSGQILYEKKPKEERVFSEETCYLISDILKESVSDGTARKLSGFDYDICAKTGTAKSARTKDNIDAWNASYTTENTVIVWYGNTTKSPEYDVKTNGSEYPTLLARQIYSILDKPSKKSFDEPSGIFHTEIDKFALAEKHTLCNCNLYTPDKYRMDAIFSSKNYPTETSEHFDIERIRVEYTQKEDFINISIDSDEDYKYILTEKNLLTNEERFWEINNGTTQIRSSNGAICSYSVKVIYDNQALGIIAPHISFF